jgi:hypothetical protein
MIAIKKTGTLLKTNEKGYLISECGSDKLQEPWQGACKDMVRLYQENVGSALHSVYVRGSLPRGRALERISDVDSFAVVREPLSEGDFRWTEKARSELLKKYPFVADFEFHWVPLQPLLTAPGLYSYRFIIKVLSLCLWGKDLGTEIRPFKPDMRLALAFYGNIREVLGEAMAFLKQNPDPKSTQACCTWTMKRLIRTGFALHIAEEKTFTRDLYPAYEIFAQHHPDQAKNMEQALHWAINPEADPKKVLEFLEGFGTWVVEEAEKIFRGL